MTGLNPLRSTLMPAATPGVLRVATYNIHKGVRGLGPRKRLEIHNLGQAVEAFDADLVFLQEVRLFHRLEARRFHRTSFGWPDQGGREKARAAGQPCGLVNEWHGPAKSIASVAGKYVYYHAGSQVLCLEGQE